MRSSLRLVALMSLAIGSLVWVSAANAATCALTTDNVCIATGPNPNLNVLAQGTGGAIFVGLVGTYSLAVVGTGSPTLSLPGILDSNIIATTGTAAGGTLQVWVTETGLTAPTGLGTPFTSSWDWNALSTADVTVQTFISAGDFPFFSALPLIPAQALAPGSTGSLLTDQNIGMPYTLTQEYTLNFGAGQSGNGTLDLSSMATPIPGALSLFAGGLGIIGLIVGRKKRKAAGTVFA